MERKHGNVFSILLFAVLLVVFKFLQKRLALLVELCLKLKLVVLKRNYFIVRLCLTGRRRFKL